MTMYWKANGERDWARELMEDNERIQAEHLARLKRKSSPEEIELWGQIFSLPIKALAFVLFLPFRYGYGKHFLFLIFVAPILLFAGAMVMGIHAHPQDFLAFWQSYVARHPGTVQWTWVIRDFVDLCRW